MLRFLVEKGGQMNFITLDDTLAGLANCISALQEKGRYKSSGAPNELYQANAYYPKFITLSNGSIDYTSLRKQEDDMYQYSEAASILHQTLKNFPESHTMWRGRQSDQKFLQNIDVSTYGTAVLKHTIDWH